MKQKPKRKKKLVAKQLFHQGNGTSTVYNCKATHLIPSCDYGAHSLSPVGEKTNFGV